MKRAIDCDFTGSDERHLALIGLRLVFAFELRALAVVKKTLSLICLAHQSSQT